MLYARTIIIAAIAFASCVARPHPQATVDGCPDPPIAAQQVPALGDVVATRSDSRCLILAASAQMWRSYALVVGGTRFTAGVDSERRVRFISTSDKAFVAPEGLRVGDPASKAVGAAPASPINSERRWGYYIELGSGWSAQLDDNTIDVRGRIDLNLGTRDLGPDARITMFFKRN